jgi:hypothetical protein
LQSALARDGVGATKSVLAVIVFLR